MSLMTPVAFMIFNRPDTPAQVFAAIRMARPPKLLVVADGPRADRPGEAESCAAARAVIDGVDWPCEVLINFAAENMGCKRRISSGLNWVFSQVEGAIILEDDCLPHPDFFLFCVKLLDRYRDDERVMMIAGTNFLQQTPNLVTSYCFSRYFPIWGWATWRRSWQKYDLELEQWPLLRLQRQVEVLYTQPFVRRQVCAMFDAAYHDRIDTWDIQWLFSCLFHNGLCAVPRVNLISNIGFLGAHTAHDHTFHDLPFASLEVEDLRHPELMYPDRRFDEAMFARTMKPTLQRRVKALYRALTKRLKQVVNSL